MNVSFFASYSYTEFTDLYYANVRSWHRHFIGCAIDLNTNDVTFFKDKIDNIPKSSNTFMIAYLADDIDKINMNFNDFSLDENERIRKKDKYLSVKLSDNILTFQTSEDNLICFDVNGSLSTTFINGYDYLDGANLYQLDISKPTWTL